DELARSCVVLLEAGACPRVGDAGSIADEHVFQPTSLHHLAEVVGGAALAVDEPAVLAQPVDVVAPHDGGVLPLVLVGPPHEVLGVHREREDLALEGVPHHALPKHDR
ncbi:unnamed protein product, partial [Ectocarpus sp. 12 AP-2014]